MYHFFPFLALVKMSNHLAESIRPCYGNSIVPHRPNIFRFNIFWNICILQFLLPCPFILLWAKLAPISQRAEKVRHEDFKHMVAWIEINASVGFVKALFFPECDILFALNNQHWEELACNLDASTIHRISLSLFWLESHVFQQPPTISIYWLI